MLAIKFHNNVLGLEIKILAWEGHFTKVMENFFGGVKKWEMLLTGFVLILIFGKMCAFHLRKCLLLT